MAYSIPTRGFESESEILLKSGTNLANLSAQVSPASLCHLGLHQAAPVHNQPITGAALGHRVAPNSATAATPQSESEARVKRKGPANGETQQASGGVRKPAQKSQQTDSAADQPSESLTHARAADIQRVSLEPTLETCKQAQIRVQHLQASSEWAQEHHTH